MKKIKLIQGIHFYVNENGFFVFTAKYLKERGYCCKNGCLHCPYGFKKNDSLLKQIKAKTDKSKDE